MGNPGKRQTNSVFVSLTILAPLLFSPPLAANTIAGPPLIDQHAARPGGLSGATDAVGMAGGDGRLAAVSPAGQASSRAIRDGRSPQQEQSAGRNARQRLAEAHAILEELHDFADTAQRAIAAGKTVQAQRLERKRLEEALAAQALGRHGLKRDLAGMEQKERDLRGVVVDRWLTSTALDRELNDERLITAMAERTVTVLRLIRLQKKLANRRAKVRSLRAETAALAAELGRARRQILNLEQQTRLIDDQRQVIETMARDLRHQVSASLRILAEAN